MNDLISICIPTYQRPELLAQAVDSCLTQDYRPLEIIIGDDSQDDTTKKMVERLQRTHTSDDLTIRYEQNRPALRQAGNVNKLFDMAQGERLVLLHDDDVLLPGAVSRLAQCWDIVPDLTAAFGKQYLISMDGKTLGPQSEHLNQTYYRTAEQEGLQQSAMASALVQQFPNDGYMVVSDVARKVRYRDERKLGTTRWCDYEFSLRLAQESKQFYFLNEYTAKYRLTDESISKHGHPVYMYPIINGLKINKSDRWAQRAALSRLAPIVVHSYALSKQRMAAITVYLSRHYGWSRRLSLRGIYHLALIAFPALVQAKNYF